MIATANEPDTNPQRRFQELLCPGITCVLSFDAGTRSPSRHRAILRGWRQDRYLLVDLPESGESEVRHATYCVVRLFSSGVAAGFKSTIMDWTEEPDRLLRVTWPDQVEILPLRKSERVPVSVPCTVTLPGAPGRPGTIADLSAGGCAVLMDGSIAPGERVNIAFDIPGGQRIDNVAAVVRSVANENGEWLMGCSFSDLDPIQSGAIHDLVSLRLDRISDDAYHDRRIVILSPGFEELPLLRSMLEAQRVELVCTACAVDALFRVRLQPPSVFVFPVSDNGVEGQTLCDLMRKAPALANVTFVLWGGPESMTMESAQKTGADSWVRSLASADAVYRQLMPLVQSRPRR